MRVVLRLAMRNLSRNRVRSYLSIGGIAVAAIMLIFNLGFIDGFYTMMIRGSTEVETGHVQVQHQAYVERPTTIDYMPYDPELGEALRGVEAVEAISPRVRLYGLVGHEERSQVGRILGIDPEREAAVTVLKQGISQGRWLTQAYDPEGKIETVIGSGLSQTLGVGVGDEVVVIAEGVDGSMGDSLLEVVGVVKTGNSGVDRSMVLVHIEEAQYIAAMEGAVHEVVMKIRDPAAAMAVAPQVQAVLDELGDEELQARSWQEVNSALYELLLVGNQSNHIIFLVIAFIVALGVLNALRMSARERMREFGVLLAVGMSRRRLFSMVLWEGVVLGVGGAVLGGIVGGGMNYYFSKKGLDFGAFMEGEATYMGVSFSDAIYFEFGIATIVMTALGLVGVTVLCAVWPAIWAVRLNARDAISGRQ